MTYIEEQKTKFMALEMPKWKRAKLPEALFPKTKDVFNAEVTGELTNIKLVSLNSALNDLAAFDIAAEDASWLKNGDAERTEHLGDKFVTYNNSSFNHGYLMHITGGSDNALKITYNLDDTQSILVDQHIIVVEPGVSFELILDYASADKGVFSHYGAVKVIAKDGANVKVTKIQRLNDESHSFDMAFSKVYGGANCKINDAQIGSAFKAFSNIQSAEDYRSNAESYSIYYGQDSAKLDLSYTINHKGKKTNSVILSKGALQENTKKVFRGNLVFDHGSTGSVGKEEEFVMLLSDKLKTDSIPGLFCKEDDVIGEHAASVGQVDENKLFYIMSRGFSEREARKLIIKSGYEEVIQAMAIGDYADVLTRAIERRIS